MGAGKPHAKLEGGRERGEGGREEGGREWSEVDRQTDRHTLKFWEWTPHTEGRQKKINF